MRHLWLVLCLFILACNRTPEPAHDAAIDAAGAPVGIGQSSEEASPEAIRGCTAANGEWRCSAKRPHILSEGNPIIPVPWQQTLWVVGGACASDTNSCTGTSCTGGGVGPCATAGEILYHRLQSISPRLQTSNYQWEFQSSASDNTDPFPFHPIMERGATLKIWAPLPSNVASGSIGIAAPTNRGSITSAGTAQHYTGLSSLVNGLFMTDTGAHAARMWIVNATSGTAAYTSQPLAPVTLPTTSLTPAEVNGTANTEPWTTYNLTSVNLVDLQPTIVDYNSVDAGINYLPVTVQNITIYDPNGIGIDPVTIGTDVSIFESRIDRTIKLVGATGQVNDNGCVNCYIDGGMIGGLLNTGHFWRINGGAIIPPPSGQACNVTGLGIALDADVTMNQSCTFPDGVSVNEVNLGIFSVVLNAGGRSYIAGLLNGYTPTAIWGPGTFNSEGRTGYDSTQGGAQGIILNPGLVTFNGSQTACAECRPPTDASCVVTGTYRYDTCTITWTPLAQDTGISTTSFGGHARGLYGARFDANMQ